MLTIESLRGYGANVDEGLSRCMGNETLYLRLVNTVCDDKSFGLLAEAIQNKDYKTAFERAHALKGAVGNLSISPLYEEICELTDALRTQEDGDYSQMLQKVLEDRERLAALKNG